MTSRSRSSSAGIRGSAPVGTTSRPPGPIRSTAPWPWSTAISSARSSAWSGCGAMRSSRAAAAGSNQSRRGPTRDPSATGPPRRRNAPATAGRRNQLNCEGRTRRGAPATWAPARAPSRLGRESWGSGSPRTSEGASAPLMSATIAPSGRRVGSTGPSAGTTSQVWASSSGGRSLSAARTVSASGGVVGARRRCSRPTSHSDRAVGSSRKGAGSALAVIGPTPGRSSSISWSRQVAA